MNFFGFVIGMGLLVIFASILAQMVGMKNILREIFEQLKGGSGL